MTRLARRLPSLLPPWTRVVLVGLLVAIGCLVAGAAYAAEGHGGHGGGEPTINWWSRNTDAPPVGWYILDFVLFIGVLVYYGRKPIKTAFAQRHERIKQAIGEAHEALVKAQGRYEEYRTKLADVEREAALHVEHGREDGARERDQIIAGARQYAERMRSDAQVAVEQDLNKAILRLQRRHAGEVLRNAEQLLTERLNDADRLRLVEESIAELERGPAQQAGLSEAPPRPMPGASR